MAESWRDPNLSNSMRSDCFPIRHPLQHIRHVSFRRFDPERLFHGLLRKVGEDIRIDFV